MSKQQRKVTAPRQARTLGAVCAQPRDNVSWGDYWMCFDEYTVSVAHQRTGEPAVEVANVPRRIFERFIDWYNDGEWPRPRKVRPAGQKGAAA